MRVLVTGGSGFVGSNIVEVLDRHDAEVLAPARAELDVTDAAAVNRYVEATRPEAIVHADAGFGYLAASVADALAAGRRFNVWDGPGLNRLASPVLATDAAEFVFRALEQAATGTLHCVGGEHVDRVTLARRSAQAFGFDPERIDVVDPDPAIVGTQPVPVDTRLDATATATQLGLELPDLATTLQRLRLQLQAIQS
jgi:dTDP-4-dehydrorhamnose reductase